MISMVSYRDRASEFQANEKLTKALCREDNGAQFGGFQFRISVVSFIYMRRGPIC